MGRFIWIVGLIGVLFISTLLVLLFLTRGDEYIRALMEVYKNPVDVRDQIKNDFFAADSSNLYGGILAGVVGNQVWVWGRFGLKPFTADEYSVYFYKDGCSDDARQNILNGTQLSDVIFTDIDKWQEVAQPGSYVVIRIATIENGGKIGNLREIHTYNYRPFLRGDINILCAR